MNIANRISFKQINALAIPSIIAGIAEPLLSIVDTAVVGNVQFDAIEALAAVGIAGSFISAIVWVIGQTRSAIAAIVAQYLGKQELHAVMPLPAQIININVLLSILIAVVTSFFAADIFELYNASGKVLDYAVGYYKIRAFGLPFSLMVFTVIGIFSGLQNTFIPMLISITGAVANAGLDFLLVYGIEGVIPPMHVEGAAYASVIAQGIMAALALYFYITKTPFGLVSFQKYHHELKRLLQISANLFVRALALHVALYLANSHATAYGKEYIAAQTICFQVWMFFAFFIDGYASVGSIVSGRLKGEQAIKKLSFLIKDLNKYGVLVALVLMLICFGAYNYIGTIFTDNEIVLEVFYSVFWLVLLSQPLNAVAFVYDGVFKGLAEAVVLRNTVVIATCFGFVPALFIADYFDLKLLGVWIAFTVWMLYRSGILFVYFRKNIKKILTR